jgi:hypothetical protein
MCMQGYSHVFDLVDVLMGVRYQYEHECFIAWLRRCRHEPQRAAGNVCLWSSSYVDGICLAEH